MKVYLVWEKESYCEYDVVFASLNKSNAEDIAKQKNNEIGYEKFFIKEIELEKFIKKEW
jgi:hypothetical protein